MKQPCVRKFEGLERSKLLGISQTRCPKDKVISFFRLFPDKGSKTKFPSRYTRTQKVCIYFVPHPPTHPSNNRIQVLLRNLTDVEQV